MTSKKLNFIAQAIAKNPTKSIKDICKLCSISRASFYLNKVEIENIAQAILAKIQENEENITIEFAHKAYLKELEIRAKLEIARMNNETKKQIAKLKKQK